MKKIAVFVIIVISGLVFGCNFEEQTPGISTIKNTSANFNVNYQFKDKINHIITAGKEESFERPLYDYIQSYEPSKRVLLNTQYPHKNDIVYTFSERQSYTVKVNNTIGEQITLSADGWMDKINVPAGGIADLPSQKVYTDKPDFTVVAASGFPAEIAYNFIDDTFYVVIKRGN